MRRTFRGIRLGIGSSQYVGEVWSGPCEVEDPILGDSAARLATVVWGRFLVSAEIRVRSGAEWRAPPLLTLYG